MKLVYPKAGFNRRVASDETFRHGGNEDIDLKLIAVINTRREARFA